MVPKFEKRVRAYAMEISTIIIILIVASLGFDNIYLKYGLVIFAYLGVTIIPMFFSQGQTFGKRIQQIKVVNLDGTNTSIFILILRELFKTLASLFTFGIYSVIAFFFVTEKNVSRTIHDYIFKTKMIDLEKPTDKNMRADDFLNKSESMKRRGL